MIAVVIPALNAARTVGTLLEQVSRQVGKGVVIVVDDGSEDATGRIAERAGALVLRHEANLGKGAALRTAFQYVLSSTECEAVITMDADLQHDAAEIPKFLAAWQKEESDCVVGFRRWFGSGMPIHRIFSNVITSALVSARTGVRIRDSQSGYRLIARSVLASIEVESDGYEAETEMLIKVAHKGFRISFVPVATIYRGAGSHMTHWHTTKQFLRVLLREYK